MLKSKFFICLLLCFELVSAQTIEDQYQLQQRQITDIEIRLESAEKHNNLFDAQLKELIKRIGALETENEALKLSMQEKQQSIDSLAKIVARNTENIQTTADSLGIKIHSTDVAVTKNVNSLKTKTKWGIGAFLLALLSVAVVGLLHMKGLRKSDDKIASLKKQADELNEKVVNQFSAEMNELQEIGNVLKNTGGNSTSTSDHSLVKKLVDRINFMEMTLHRMDSSVRGFNSLTNAINVIKIRLKDNNYEIVDWLGKQYDEGYNFAEVVFEDDFELEEGQRIISEVLQPQINFQGKMIQAAKVKVKQNTNE